MKYIIISIISLAMLFPVCNRRQQPADFSQITPIYHGFSERKQLRA